MGDLEFKPFADAHPSLTCQAYAAGAPCPGCGLPYKDDEPWDSKGSMYWTEGERARHDAEEARFKGGRHGSCGMSSFTLQGSLTKHCMRCCPPPPLSPGQRDELGRILRGARR